MVRDLFVVEATIARAGGRNPEGHMCIGTPQKSPEGEGLPRGLGYGMNVFCEKKFEYFYYLPIFAVPMSLIFFPIQPCNCAIHIHNHYTLSSHNVCTQTSSSWAHC